MHCNRLELIITNNKKKKSVFSHNTNTDFSMYCKCHCCLLLFVAVVHCLCLMIDNFGYQPSLATCCRNYRINLSHVSCTVQAIFKWASLRSGSWNTWANFPTMMSGGHLDSTLQQNENNHLCVCFCEFALCLALSILKSSSPWPLHPGSGGTEADGSWHDGAIVLTAELMRPPGGCPCVRGLMAQNAKQSAVEWGEREPAKKTAKGKRTEPANRCAEDVEVKVNNKRKVCNRLH